MNDGITLPFKVLPVISEVGRTRLEANVSVRSTFSNKMQVRTRLPRVPAAPSTEPANPVGLGRHEPAASSALNAVVSPAAQAGPVVVLVPVPDNTASAKLLVTAGRAKYDATKKALVWKMSKFVGGAEHTLRAEVTLVASTREKKAWGRPPIQMQFQVRGAGVASGTWSRWRALRVPGGVHGCWQAHRHSPRTHPLPSLL